MGFWRRLFGGSGADEINPQRLDYLNEALALERQGDYDSALTSYRLALRDHPNDARILQNMAIAFTKTRRIDERRNGSSTRRRRCATSAPPDPPKPPLQRHPDPPGNQAGPGRGRRPPAHGGCGL